MSARDIASQDQFDAHTADMRRRWERRTQEDDGCLRFNFSDGENDFQQMVEGWFAQALEAGCESVKMGVDLFGSILEPGVVVCGGCYPYFEKSLRDRDNRERSCDMCGCDIQDVGGMAVRMMRPPVILSVQLCDLCALFYTDPEEEGSNA